MDTQEHALPRQPGSHPGALTRIFSARNVELAAGAIQEALCRMFERVANVLMAYGDETRSAKKEAL